MTFSPAFFREALAARGLRLGDAVGEARAITTDSRQASTGELFVALRGERYDGHDFVAAALEAGAGGAVVDAAPAGVDETKLIVVDDTLRALQDLARHHLERCGARRVALSGSNGKTTTKEMIAAALRGALGEDAVHATKGNLNNHIGLPLTALALEEGHQVAVLEMGMNHLKEIELLCEIVRPQIGLLTNIGIAHAGNVGGIEGVAQAKGELFEGLAPGGVCVVNLDDERVVKAADRAPAGSRRVTFGRDPQADVRVTSVTPTASGMLVELVVDGATHRAELGVVGEHNAVNAAGAIAVAKALDLDVAAAVAGQADLRDVPGRLRSLPDVGGRLVLDDTYNANPDSTRAALRTLRDRGEGRRLIVALGEMLELGDDAAAQHASVAEEAVRAGVARVFACGELGRAYLEGARMGGLDDDEMAWAEDSEALAPVVVARSGPGDALLIKGSRGARMERVVEALLAAKGEG